MSDQQRQEKKIARRERAKRAERQRRLTADRCAELFNAAVWARNLFDARNLAYPPSYPYGMFTTYERARTFGLDLTFRY